MNFRNGQAALEYVLAVLAAVLLVGVISHVVVAAHRSAERTNSLVRSDCP